MVDGTAPIVVLGQRSQDGWNQSADDLRCYITLAQSPVEMQFEHEPTSSRFPVSPSARWSPTRRFAGWGRRRPGGPSRTIAPVAGQTKYGNARISVGIGAVQEGPQKCRPTRDNCIYREFHPV